jgi:hypothetical protein
MPTVLLQVTGRVCETCVARALDRARTGDGSADGGFESPGRGEVDKLSGYVDLETVL